MSSSARAAFTALAICLFATSPLAMPAAAGPLLLLDAGNGRILYAEDQDQRWFPASITKIMTAYIVFEAMKAGRVSPTDTVTVSEHAHVQPPSKLGLPVGAEITVEQALKVLIVKSANDVAVMLAEKIAGSEAAFIALMNDTAKRLGMTRTNFVNPNGLPAAGQVSTARDLARLGRAVLQQFPDHRDMWAMSEVQVGKQRLKSHNELLRTFDGADGIKTGFICDSGFNVVATAVRDGRRLIAVVLGEPSGRDRNIRAAALLQHGFDTADWKATRPAPTIDSLPLERSAQQPISVRTSVVAWNCNPRKKVLRKPANRKRPPATAGRKTSKPAQAASPAPQKQPVAKKSAAPAGKQAAAPQPKPAPASKKE